MSERISPRVARPGWLSQNRSGRGRRATRLAALALSLAITTVGCSGTDGQPVSVVGPLCEALPSGTDPGNPASLAGEPADVALRWITVLAKFEAALRAAGMAAELHNTHGVTILAPTDDAFARKFSETNLDELFLAKKDDLRRLLNSHLVDGAMSLSDLRDAGSVTTLAGTSLKITRDDSMVRIGDRAETLCADYRVANARIHVISEVLGDFPTTAQDEEHHG